jgi:hypothetical protein
LTAGIYQVDGRQLYTTKCANPFDIMSDNRSAQVARQIGTALSTDTAKPPKERRPQPSTPLVKEMDYMRQGREWTNLVKKARNYHHI